MVWPATWSTRSVFPAPLFWATSTVPATAKPAERLITRKTSAQENESALTAAWPSRPTQNVSARL